MTEADLLVGFSDNLEYMMKKHGVNQSELSRESGVSREAINKYLNCQRMPSLKAIVNLSYALKCDLDDLVPFTTTLIID